MTCTTLLLVLEGHVDDHAARAVASDNVVPPGPRQSPRLYSHPEEDRDHLYHGKLPAFQPEPQVPIMQEKLGSMIYSNPEEDRDHLYHGKLPAFQPEPQVPIMQEKLGSMIYSNPEEDRDHLYHK
uniref:Uncharacterized protein n=1 Tax=Scleropages formosus TaxID=113540 RepID=A0A8C9V5H3_SCLFO